MLADLAEQFERDYRAAVQACLRPGLPLTACTIYNGNFPDPAYQRLVTTALALFNDAILRVAIDQRLPVIDLRVICARPEDYANAIEPSSVGGAKIARAIAALATETNPTHVATRIIAGQLRLSSLSLLCSAYHQRSSGGYPSSYQGTETRGCWIAAPDNALASAESRVHRTNATNLIWRHQTKGQEEYRSQGAPAMMRIILMG